MQIIELDDLSRPELAPFARLTEAQLRNRRDPEQGLFIAESPKVIEKALDAGCQPVSFLMERRHIDGQGSGLLARCGGVPVYTGDRELLAELTGFALTRGILCAMRRPTLPEVSALCASARRLAVLDGIVDPANVGAIFRSAAALGMDGVLLTPSCCDPLYRRAARVSMGAVFQIPWCRLEREHADWPSLLREQGFKTAALALRDDALPIDAPALARESRLALVLGTEGDGLSEPVIQGCDYTVLIPMSHGVNSLNVAMASDAGPGLQQQGRRDGEFLQAPGQQQGKQLWIGRRLAAQAHRDPRLPSRPDHIPQFP